MITELHNIKEVEITEKKELKYYFLFQCDPNAEYAEDRYYLIDQHPDPEYLKSRTNGWELS